MNNIELIIKEYGNKGLLVDSNLLLLYFIGKFDLQLIGNESRTGKYSKDDFRILSWFISSFTKLVTTPNILTEVSNLSPKLSGDTKTNYFNSYSNEVTLLTEYYSPSYDICSQVYFEKFGLTDAGMIQLVTNEYLVLSDDLKLVHFMQGNRIGAINFHYLKQNI